MRVVNAKEDVVKGSVSGFWRIFELINKNEENSKCAT